MVYVNNSINNKSNEDVLVTTATAAVDRALTVSNTDNTAVYSASHVQVTVGGTTSTGDPYINFNIPGGSTYSIGPDNSNSDVLTVTNGANPSAGTTIATISTSLFATPLPAVSQTTDSDNIIAYHEIVNSHTSNASAAGFTAGVSHTSTSDPFSCYTVKNFGSSTCVTQWAEGIDNSDSDTWKLGYTLGAAGATIQTPSTVTPTISITTAGVVTVPAGDFFVQRGAVGTSVQNYCYNTDNTNAASGAGLAAKSGGTSAGDAYTYYEISGQQAWITGIDNSDLDKWKLSASSALGTTDVIISTIAGEVTKPLQPAFLGVLGSGVNDVTGNSAPWQLGTTVALTEIFDQNADFNTNGTFTAPVTGRYQLNGGIRLNQITSAMTSGYLQIITTNRTYTFENKNAAAIRTVASFADYVSFAASVFADMTAGDTATLSVTLFGAAGNTADVVADPASFFSGFLAC